MIILADEPDNGDGHTGAVKGERRTADPSTRTEVLAQDDNLKVKR